MNKKVYRKRILMLILVVVLLLSNVSYGMLDVNAINIRNKYKNSGKDVAGEILGALKVISVFIFVGMTMIVGIKYMLSSAEEKAEYKNTMLTYMLSAALIFATTNIVNFIYQIFN